MTKDEAILGVNAAPDALAAAEVALEAILGFRDTQMGDGDGARDVAEAWLDKWPPSEGDGG